MPVTYKQKFNKKYRYKINESHSLKEISDITGYSYLGLQKIFNKGIGAYKTNPGSVRPSVKSPEQWAYGRVYSAVMGGKAQKIDESHLKKSKMKSKSTTMNTRSKKIKELTDAIYKSGYFKRSRIFQDEFNRGRVYEARTVPKTKRDYEMEIMQLSGPKLDRLHKKYVKTTKKKTIKKSSKMNAFMKAKEKARKANKASFTYNGKTYKRAKTKTGMVIYKRSR